MKNIIPGTGVSLASVDVLAFEQGYVQLPPLYKAFLLRYNGCVLSSNVFIRPLESDYQQELDIERMASLQALQEAWPYVKGFAEELSLLYVASTPGQPMVCVGLAEFNADQVFVDSDFGITYLAANIVEFIETKLLTNSI